MKNLLKSIGIFFVLYANCLSQQYWNSSKITNFSLTSIDYINGDTLYAYSTGHEIFKTTNKGINWHMHSGSLPWNVSVKNVNNDMAYMCGPFHEVSYTSNSGITWSTRALWSNINAGYAELGFISLVNPTTAFTGGYCNTWHYINVYYKTTNSGLNWQEYIVNNSEFKILDISFKNENEGIMLGSSRMYKTSNSGNTFTEIGNLPIYIGLGMSEYRDTMYVFGYETGIGRVARSINSGNDWTVFPQEFTRDLRKIFCVDGRTIYLCGNKGKIYKSIDAGNNWTDLSYNTNLALNDICFINANSGFIVGDSGLVLKTINGGVYVNTAFSNIPDQYSLSQNYPNPFNPSTKINYELKQSGFTTLKVFDLLGKEVASLVNEKQNAGSYAVDFNSLGYNIPSGIYFYTLTAGDFKEIKKMMLVK